MSFWDRKNAFHQPKKVRKNTGEAHPQQVVYRACLSPRAKMVSLATIILPQITLHGARQTLTAGTTRHQQLTLPRPIARLNWETLDVKPTGYRPRPSRYMARANTTNYRKPPGYACRNTSSWVLSMPALARSHLCRTPRKNLNTPNQLPNSRITCTNARGVRSQPDVSQTDGERRSTAAWSVAQPAAHCGFSRPSCARSIQPYSGWR